MKVTFFIKVPKGAVKSFCVIRRVTLPDGKKRNSTLSLPQIDSLNASYHSAMVTLEEATRLAKRVCKDLQVQEKLKDLAVEDRISEANAQALAEFWYMKYEKDRYYLKIVDPEGYKNDLTRAIKVLGTINIRTASLADIENRIEGVCAGNPAKAARVASRLQVMRHFFGFSGERICPQMNKFDTTNPLEEIEDSGDEVRILDEKEFLSMVPNIKNSDFRTLCYIGFYTGLRYSEMFPLDGKVDFVKKFINVTTQLTIRKDPKTRRPVYCLRPPKNEKPRKALLVRKAIPWVQKWLAIDKKTRFQYRKTWKAGLMLNEAYVKTFGSSARYEKIVFHDLRHCNGRWLGSFDLTAKRISEHLGNTVEVCEKHYLGKVLTPVEISGAIAVIDGEDEEAA